MRGACEEEAQTLNFADGKFPTNLATELA